MKKEVFNKLNKFFDMYNNMDKWVVIAKCNDGDIVINKDGVIAFDLDTAKEIAMNHINMGVKIDVMQYEKYLELYKQEN